MSLHAPRANCTPGLGSGGARRFGLASGSGHRRAVFLQPFGLSSSGGKDDQEIADLKRQLAAYGEKAA